MNLCEKRYLLSNLSCRPAIIFFPLYAAVPFNVSPGIAFFIRSLKTWLIHANIIQGLAQSLRKLSTKPFVINFNTHTKLNSVFYLQPYYNLIT